MSFLIIGNLEIKVARKIHHLSFRESLQETTKYDALQKFMNELNIELITTNKRGRKLTYNWVYSKFIKKAINTEINIYKLN